MTLPLASFEDIIKTLDKPKLLLGNGFSRAYDNERFSFISLLESAVKAGIIEKESKVYKVFGSLMTSDFESVMRALEDTTSILEVYEGDEKLQKQIRTDIENLKGYLVQIITNNHPTRSTEVEEDQKESCAKFLKHFESIYTLNYDLLLYWAVMQNPKVTEKFTDGFGEDDESIDSDYVVYKNQSGDKLHYLHGGLHIFDAGHIVIKKTYSKTNTDLITQIRENLDKHIYPIFISEGSSKQKIAKIVHSAYLIHCYKSLSKIGGDLVIFGTYLKTNDEHILDAIMSSKVKHIYMGVSSVDSVSHIQQRIDEYNKDAKPKNQKHLHLYDYKTINPWQYGTKK